MFDPERDDQAAFFGCARLWQVAVYQTLAVNLHNCHTTH
jgi:hypothetical protein